MIRSLRGRLTLSYVLVALLCVVLVSALANGILENSFRRYVSGNQESRNRRTVELLAAQVAADTGDRAGIQSIGMNALAQGMIVKVTDATGRTVWDAKLHNNGLCEQMISHMERNMASRYRNWRGAYTEALYPLRSGFFTVGSVSIGYYGPFFLSDEDLSFINALNRLLLLVALVSLACAAGVGILMARGIAVPLARVVAATQGIAAGRRGIVLSARTGVRELDGISSAVNDLSRSLEEQESLRRRLAADVAHELRTPLATLQSHLEALIDGIWRPDRARLSALHEETVRMNRLVSDLEKLDRLEDGSAPLDRTERDIPQLVRGICAHNEPRFREKGVDLAFTAPGGLPLVSVDADRLSQAVINVLANALDFTPRGGTVAVVVSARENDVEIRVSDTGSGIRPEDLPHIFERLYRADPSRSRATGGAGIGLSIARAIIQAHGGTITAASVPGEGSTFTILLAS